MFSLIVAFYANNVSALALCKLPYGGGNNAKKKEKKMVQQVYRE